MKKVYLMNLLLIILLISTLSGCKKSVNYTPETREELRALVDNDTVKLSSINTSKITDMSKLFANAESFNQDISSWNVSNVANMSTMSTMFAFALSFNKDLSKWKVADNVTKEGAFWGSPLENNLPTWFNKK